MFTIKDVEKMLQSYSNVRMTAEKIFFMLNINDSMDAIIDQDGFITFLGQKSGKQITVTQVTNRLDGYRTYAYRIDVNGKTLVTLDIFNDALDIVRGFFYAE